MWLLDNDTVQLWKVGVTLTKESDKEARNISNDEKIFLRG